MASPKGPLASFHPTIQAWFQETLGEPTRPQSDAWPRIREGGHVLVAAPTGSGKTLTAFLNAIDDLARRGHQLPDETAVLYVSPLKALSNDVQKNLQGPLDDLRERDPTLPEIRVTVRTGDTPAAQRTAMRKRPPHILVTTPESLYVLMGSESGRTMLATVGSVIVDEIHALARDKRGSHLALSLERLDKLVTSSGRPSPQRIGLSATQRPIEETAALLGGVNRDVHIVDGGHLRHLDLAIEVPDSPLETVCSHETWGEAYNGMVRLIDDHQTTLVFVNTRKLAERIAARLTDRLGEDVVSCHHGSLSRARRLDAEERLKNGQLRALVATASLELGIDIGDVDLVIQVGSTPAIATFLQRVGRAGHGVHRTPKGRIFPLTIDELAESAALLESVNAGELDRTIQPVAPLDILAQQMVAACVGDAWGEDELYDTLRRAHPYRDLARSDFDDIIRLHTDGRGALLHRDGVNRRLRATKRARLTAITCGGAIPDVADYTVIEQPAGLRVGRVNEDFAIESSAGDIFQLGNTSWQILKVEQGKMYVRDAQGVPPTLPFWLGEAPSRTEELSQRVAGIRVAADGGPPAVSGLPASGAEQLHEHAAEGRRVLGAVPTQAHVVLERFFDETGGMQLILHAPFGSRINRAWGLALRKRFCVGFGFELQAAATEDALLLSLGPQHSFPLEEVFDYLHPDSVEEVLTQALLTSPMFETRWRWNVGRSLLVERFQSGRRVPAPLLRMRSDDALAKAFPDVAACFETLDAGPIKVPMDHPIVRQTVLDCLHEAMDIDGLRGILQRIRDGAIQTSAVDTPEPSVFAHHIISARPYAFLDDAPLEERRTQAVMTRRALKPADADGVGALDPEAIERVRREAWPSPGHAEEVHEALTWMGYVTNDEAGQHGWIGWLEDLDAAGRVQCDQGRWFAAEASREPTDVLAGRLEALGPVAAANFAKQDLATLQVLEERGLAMRCRIDGEDAWCDRRLLARVHRYTIERLRSDIRPVPPATFLRFLAQWQHATPETMLDGPVGVETVLNQLAGYEVPASQWEQVLRARVKGYRPEFLDNLTLSGRFAWGRLWGRGNGPVRSAPIAFVPRHDLAHWQALDNRKTPDLDGYAGAVFDVLTAKGAVFPQEIETSAGLLPSQVEEGVGRLISQGVVTGDSFASLRHLLRAPSRRPRRGPGAHASLTGRLSILATGAVQGDALDPTEDQVAFVAKVLLARTGVVFKRTLERERMPIPWRLLVRHFKRMELRGDVRGGRFVEGFAGEQFALPQAVEALRRLRRQQSDGQQDQALDVPAGDPLNLHGILDDDPRVSPLRRDKVAV